MKKINIIKRLCALLIVTAGFMSCDKDNNTAPTLTLNGETNQTLCLGDLYNELGATATDADGNKIDVTVTSNVDTNAIGNYAVSLSATDANGNTTTIDGTVDIEFCLTSLYGEYSVNHDCTAMGQNLISDTQNIKAGSGDNVFIIENFNSVINEVTGNIDLNAMTVNVPEETMGMSGVDVTISGEGTINTNGDVEITFTYSGTASGIPVTSGSCTATYSKVLE